MRIDERHASRRKSVSTALKPSEVRAVRRIARREGVTVARVIRKAVRDLLAEEAAG